MRYAVAALFAVLLAGCQRTYELPPMQEKRLIVPPEVRRCAENPRCREVPVPMPRPFDR
jgi:hypothetical protein